VELLAVMVVAVVSGIHLADPFHVIVTVALCIAAVEIVVIVIHLPAPQDIQQQTQDVQQQLLPAQENTAMGHPVEPQPEHVGRF